MWRYRSVIVYATLVVGAAASAWAAQLPDRYRASALLVLKPQNFPEEYVRLVTTERAQGVVQVIREILLSRSLLGRVVDEFDLYPDLRTTHTSQEILEAMRRDITIRLKGNDVFMIAYQGPDPGTVVAVTNHLADAFVDLLRSEVKIDPVSHRVRMLETRLKELDKQRTDLSREYTDNFPEVINLERQIEDVASELDRERIRTGAMSTGRGMTPAPRGEAQILDRAVLPDKPSPRYRWAVALAGFLSGSVIGMAWALVRSLTDRTFRDVYDVEATTQVPVLGAVCRLADGVRPRRRLLRGLFEVGSGAATLSGVWYLAWNFQDIVRWAARWWKGMW